MDVNGLPGLIRGLEDLTGQLAKANERFLIRVSLLAQRDAKRNAPRSPTQEQINANRKTKRNTSKQKNVRATSRAKPGGLERSIDSEVLPDQACVFVALNSEAGLKRGQT